MKYEDLSTDIRNLPGRGGELKFHVCVFQNISDREEISEYYYWGVSPSYSVVFHRRCMILYLSSYRASYLLSD